MPTNIVDTSTFTDPIVTPASGDARTAASVATAVQGLSNRSRYMKNRIPGALTATGRSIPLACGQVDILTGTLAAWDYKSNAWVQKTATSAAKLVIDLSMLLPDGVTVTALETFCHGNILGTGAHSNLPAVKPSVKFAKLNADLTINYSVNQSDNPVSVPAYETNHILGGTALVVNTVIDSAYRYIVQVAGEDSTDALADRFGFLRMAINWTAP